MMYFIAIIICVPLTFALNSFINIWYEGEIYTNFLARKKSNKTCARARVYRHTYFKCFLKKPKK